MQTATLDRAGHAGWSALRFKDPTLPVWIGAALLLVFLMLLPLGAIFRASLWDESGFTFGRYLEVFTNEQFLKAIWNTLIISTWVGVISVVHRRAACLAGGAHGPAVEKTDPRPGHGVVRDAAVLGRVCVDPARRAQRRRAE